MKDGGFDEAMADLKATVMGIVRIAMLASFFLGMIVGILIGVAASSGGAQ